jgi:hypothetical protein
MAGKSDYIEGVMLRQWLGQAFSFTALSNVYIALYSAAPTDAGGGTQLTGGSYARVTVPNNSANWGIVSGKLSNLNQVTFPVATANWLGAVAVGIFDALTVGNLLFWQAFSPTVAIQSGSRLVIPVNGLQLAES